MRDFDYEELARQLNIKGRRSGDQLVGRCPLHQDNSPSFSLNLKYGAWTCFSSCGTGNFEHLVMKILGGTILEAKDWILQSASLLPVSNPIKSTTEPLLDLRWLHRFNSIDRHVMPQWWFDRGLTWETADKWDVRYDDEDAKLVIPFYKYPFKMGIDKMLLGTITRNLKSGPKYKNSSGLPRSKCLFGLAQAHGPLILIVEGALDCIWLQQCGYFPVAALLGLDMTNEHIILLHGFGEICLAMDNDEPGIKAANKIENLLMNSGRPKSTITRLTLPEGRKDVSNCTVLELEQAFENRRSQ